MSGQISAYSEGAQSWAKKYWAQGEYESEVTQVKGQVKFQLAPIELKLGESNA